MWVERSCDDPRLGQADQLGVQLVRLIRLFERTGSQLGPVVVTGSTAPDTCCWPGW